MSKRNFILIFLNMMLFIGFTQLDAVAQRSSSFSGTGDWSDASNWDNGIPDSTVDASVSAFGNLTADADGSCADLSFFLSSMTINAGVTLTIHGLYTPTTTGNNINNGTLIVKGGIKPAIGTQVLTIGGGVTIASGLSFPNFTID